MYAIYKGKCYFINIKRNTATLWRHSPFEGSKKVTTFGGDECYKIDIPLKEVHKAYSIWFSCDYGAFLDCTILDVTDDAVKIEIQGFKGKITSADRVTAAGTVIRVVPKAELSNYVISLSFSLPEAKEVRIKAAFDTVKQQWNAHHGDGI